MDEATMKLKEMIERAERIAFLGGAGVSTESGIPDFRGEKGIFAALSEYGERPETLLSHSYFMRHTETFFDYYRKYLLCPDAKPNPAHYALARLEKQGKLTAVITQNIDGLHQAAGSRNVLELHGSVHRNHCMRCGRVYNGMDTILNAAGVPRCECGGIIKPDVVLYEEGLDGRTLGEAVQTIAEADMLLIGGTQLSVYPAAGLIDYFRGRDIALINLSATSRDSGAALTVRRKIGEVLNEIVP